MNFVLVRYIGDALLNALDDVEKFVSVVKCSGLEIMSKL